LSWFVYILKCKDNSLYTGITNDLEKRIKVHNLGKGAKYTKARLPVSLLYCETYQTKGDALRRELEIKKLKRIEKLALVD
tara:strand:+ start:2059 stop:2298 length:240 start_codon:yes stop_codon:yes gene_type:complete